MRGVVAIASELGMEIVCEGEWKQRAGRYAGTGRLPDRTGLLLRPPDACRRIQGSVFTARSKNKIRSKGPPVPMGNRTAPFPLRRFFPQARLFLAYFFSADTSSI